MKAKQLAYGILAATVTMSSAALAGRYSESTNYTDYAQVIKAKPIYETVRENFPERQCWNEVTRVQKHKGHDHHSRSHANGTNALVGAVIGGVIGNQIGKGKGRKAATVAGTLVGASIGANAGSRHHDHDSRKDRHHTTKVVERHCELVDNYVERKEITGYRVKYRYNGQTYVTHMNHDPGHDVRVNVSVTIAE